MKVSEFREFAFDIKIEHSLFALPFAFIGALAAEFSGHGSLGYLLAAQVLLAMVFARTAAMGFNRLLDANIDADNPRTVTRAIPAGRLSKRTLGAFVSASSIVFIAVSFWINDLAGQLSPIALAVILGYSATKRFTAFSHLVLGLALSLAPAGGWVAVAGKLDLSLLSLMTGVLLWVAGFDILYALLDMEFDRRRGLFSIPSRFGEPIARWISRFLHAAACLALWHFGEMLGLGVSWRIACVVTASILAAEHYLARDRKKIPVAFFNLNAVIGFVMLLGFIY